MPSSSLSYQAVILAGGVDKRLNPLCSAGTPKALLPVANKPLISYPLKNIQEAGLKHVFVVGRSCVAMHRHVADMDASPKVVSGEKASAAISSWLMTEYAASGGSLQYEVHVLCSPSVFHCTDHSVSDLRSSPSRRIAAPLTPCALVDTTDFNSSGHSDEGISLSRPPLFPQFRTV